MYLNSGLVGHVFEFRTTGSCIWISDYWVMYLNFGLLNHVFEFRTTGSRIWIPDYWIMYLNSGLQGHVFELRTSGSCIWIPDYWLEVTMHPEGPATSQIDECCPYIPSVLVQIQRLYPNSTFHILQLICQYRRQQFAPVEHSKKCCTPEVP